MKKIFVVLAVVVLALMLWATPVLAAGDGDIDIELGEIIVTPSDGFYAGSWVTISGEVYVSSSAWAYGFFPYAEAYAIGGYEVTNPEGETVACSFPEDYEEDWNFYGGACADAEVSIPWSVKVYLDSVGNWEVNQGGYGNFSWSYYKWCWLKQYEGDGEDYDEAKVIFQSFKDDRPLPGLQVGMPYGHDYCDYSEAAGTTSELYLVGKVGGTQYVIIVPKGTFVKDNSGARPKQVFFNVAGDKVTTSIPLVVTFSKTCTLYRVDGYTYRTQAGQWTGGTLIEVCKF